jgi:hypothetical protein
MNDEVQRGTIVKWNPFLEPGDYRSNIENTSNPHVSVSLSMIERTRFEGERQISNLYVKNGIVLFTEHKGSSWWFPRQAYLVKGVDYE